ncbi:YrdB family protein [Microbacterium immunditiarum]|uniref:ABC-type amino acid transport system permease subunit n=1 Tax=Microbacterium immunditiarum TaxID=337480 RepID=A0A7Y9KJ25_9MICO|nr:YrdB family protein [Microbacterium immunditiarum]NYE21172.1 ABC-type amino acid transport system permease subunit [Microbacterium immunditiarum]
MPDKPDQTPATTEAGTVPRITGIDILAFLCELFAFASLAIWGFVAWPFPWNIVFGIATPVVAIVVWALFVSPRAVLAVHPFVRGVVELLVYVSATIAWWSLGATWVGLIFGVVAVTVGVFAGRRRFA